MLTQIQSYHSYTRQQLIYLAKLSQLTQDNKKLISIMKLVVDLGIRLDRQQRDLLKVGYYMQIQSYRVLSHKLDKLEQKQVQKFKELRQKYKQKAFLEVKDLCLDFIGLLNVILSSKILNDPNKPGPFVIYLKIKGDFCRYLSQFSKSYDPILSNNFLTKTSECYKQAIEVCQKQFKITDYYRLMIYQTYINFLDCYNDHQKAIEIALKVFKQATEQFQQEQPYYGKKCDRRNTLSRIQYKLYEREQ